MRGLAGMDRWYRAYQLAKLQVAPVLRGGILSVEIHSPGVGFFGQLNWCAEILLYCAQRHVTAQLSATSTMYRDPSRGANWLSYFFDVVEKTPHVDFRISHLSELCIALKYFEAQSIEGTSALVSRHLPLKQEIRNKLDEFCKEHFRGRKMLGVHFRVTDKTDE